MKDRIITNENLRWEEDEVINMANFLSFSKVNGPKDRCVIWVQGCLLKCPGCFNPNYQSMGAAEPVPVHVLAERILALKGIDGVTFTGGEPFLQARPLACLAEKVKKKGLSVVTYTGYTLAEIKEKNDPHWNALLDQTDLLIDGPYMKDIPTQLPWQGSGNQKLHFLTDRFADIKNEITSLKKGFEIHIGNNGKIQITGFPDNAFKESSDEFFKNLFTKLGKSPVY